jgi:3-hydroxyisobutyrate dehydrogenase-like beta-hydroxyacid dehydrogenase
MLASKLDKVAVIGLGVIGSRVAERLRKADKYVYVWSRSPKPEPNFLGSPAEIAKSADAVQIFVGNGDDLLKVIEGMEPHLKRKHIILNHSTVDVDAVHKADRIVTSAGASFLDAPFTGSKRAAAEGNIVYYVGGDTAALDRVRPVLQASAKEIIHVGKVGDAMVLKITTNMVTAATVQALCEALAVTRAQGVDGAKLMQAIFPNACCSDLVRMKLPTMLEGNYETNFALKHMFKDAQLALDLANRSKIEIPALSTTASMMFKLMQKGLGSEDYSVLNRNYAADLPAS